MLLKINDRIINTDHITRVEYSNPEKRPFSRLTIFFGAGSNGDTLAFDEEEEADKLWSLLCAEARDVLAS